MKKLFTLFLIFAFFFACSNPVQAPKVNDVVETNLEDPSNTPTNPIKLALYDGEKLIYYDGIAFYDAYLGNISQAAPRVLSVDDVLYYFDDYGAPMASYWLPAIPEAITVKPSGISAKGTIVYDDDVYTLERIDPAEAYSLGALYKEYTRIFENDVEVGSWNLNQWRAKQVFTIGNGDIVALDDMSAYHNISGDREYWKAFPGGMAIYEHDATHRTAMFTDATGDYPERWGNNIFNSSRWQEAGGAWYSSVGYTWTPSSGLIEHANKLWDFINGPCPVTLENGQKPIVIPAGTRTENSEEVTYWIECDTGYLFRLVASTNTLTNIARIYIGQNTQIYGALVCGTLEPVIIDDVLYFHLDGSIYQYNFATHTVSVFSGDMEIFGW